MPYSLISSRKDQKHEDKKNEKGGCSSVVEYLGMIYWWKDLAYMILYIL